MKGVSIAITAIVVGTCGLHCLAGEITNPTPQPVSVATQATDRVDITTQSGEAYKNCRVTRAEPDGITVTHSKGIAKIPFADLPAEMQEKYQYDPLKADAYRRAIAKSQAETAKREQQMAKQKKLTALLDAGAFTANLTVIQLIDNTSALCKGWLRSVQTNEYEVAVTKQVPYGLAGPGMVRKTKPVTTKEKRTSVDSGPVDNICVVGIPDHMVDGSTFSTRLYVAGRYRYTTVRGAAATVYRYATSKALAIELLRQEKDEGLNDE